MKKAALLGLLLLAPATAHAKQIVVPQVSTTGVDKNIATLVTELILEALLNRHGVKALGPSDLKDMLDVEQQKMLVGCDQNSCMAEIAGAMGANRVVAGMIGRLGSLYVVTLKLIDTQSAQVVSRASRRFQKVEQVPEAVGPLVDDLLSAKPRTVRTSPILELDKPKKKKKKAMLVREFCKAAGRYAKMLQKEKYSSKMVDTRRSLLEDALFTKFLKQFDEKMGCLRSHGGRTSSKLYGDLRRSTTKEDADDRRRRLLEWRELDRLAELLIEAYHVGFEKEKHGAGSRPAELPFDVVAREPDVPENSESVRRFLDDYQSAQQTVKGALDAARQNKERTFRKLWTPEDPKRSRTSIGYVFKTVSGYKKNGYETDLCPIFIISASDIEKSAARYEKTKVIEGCFRRQRKDYVTTDRVKLKNPSGSKWLIDRW